MKTIARWIFSALVWIPVWAAAQVATYDLNTNVLTLPAVTVGSDTYVNVTLHNIGNYTFRLQNAVAGSGPATNTYNATTGVLTLPVVQLGSASYTNVALQNIGNYTFTVGAATFSSAEGAWKGTTPDGRAFNGGVMDDGSIYFLYSAPGNPNGPGGLLVGNGASVNAAFSSSSLVDFNFEGRGVLQASMAANYVTRQTLNGSITHAGNVFPLTFTSTYDSDYDSVPTLALIAGTYSVNPVLLVVPPGTFEAVTLTISASGVLTSTNAFGCVRTGQLTVHGRGLVFDVTYTEGAGCPLAGQTFKGIASFNANKNQVVIMMTNSARTIAVVFAGGKM
jgi:hypothetical protein